MDLALITAKQVIVLFCLIFAGYICTKTGVIKLEYKKAFSDLLLYLVVPIMVIHSYMTDFDPSVLSNLLLAFGLSFVLILMGLIITMVMTFKMQGKNVPIFRFACIFSNAAYMGFPLIEALLGQEGLLYASAFVTVFNLLLWTVGYTMLNPNVQKKSYRTYDLHHSCTNSSCGWISDLFGANSNSRYHKATTQFHFKHEYTAFDADYRYHDCKQ